MQQDAEASADLTDPLMGSERTNNEVYSGERTCMV